MPATGWVSRSGSAAKAAAPAPQGKQAVNLGPHIPGLDDEQPAAPQEADALFTATTRAQLEARAGIQSLDALNAEIIQLAADYGDILHLFRGGGVTADAARKRHRAIMGKQIEAFREEKGLPKLSDKNREDHANASPEHIAFCAKMDLDGVQYELVRAKKEALEACRDSRLDELRIYGKELGLAR